MAGAPQQREPGPLAPAYFKELWEPPAPSRLPSASVLMTPTALFPVPTATPLPLGPSVSQALGNREPLFPGQDAERLLGEQSLALQALTQTRSHVRAIRQTLGIEI